MANRNLTREKSQPSALSGNALELVAQFLLPKDLGTSRAVCKIWNEDLRASNSFVWKQAALNIEPGIMQAVIDDAESREGGTADTVDFYRLAVGLSISQTERYSRKARNPQLSGHKQKAAQAEPFRIEDLLVVVEVKRKVVEKDEYNQDVTVMKSLGVFTCSDCSNLLQGCAFSGGVELNVPGDRAFTIEGRNSLHKGSSSAYEYYSASRAWNELKEDLSDEAADLNDDPERWRECFLFALTEAGNNVVEKRDLVESLVLIRKDDWRSIHISHKLISGSIEISTTGAPEVPTEKWKIESSTIKNSLGNLHLNCRTTYGFLATPTFTSGSAEEPTWLRKIRSAAHYSDLNWTDQDEEELCNLESFSFRLSSLSLQIDLLTKEERHFVVENDRLAKLGDLDWK